MTYSGGTIDLKGDITSFNIDCIFANNTSEGYEGGGAFNMEYNVSVTTVNCTFMHNKGANAGAMHGHYGVEIVNTNSKFMRNHGRQGGAINIGYRQCTSSLYPGVPCHNSRLINTNCIFEDNYASDIGGVMVLWYGVNSSNINCNFTQNQGK